MKNFIIKIVEKLHLLIFGHKMSDQMKKFMVNLSWSFYSGAVSTPISIIIGTLAGRFLGPKEYGNYNLVILISSYIIVFAFCGLDTSATKRIVKANSRKEKDEAFFSSFVFITLMLAIISATGIITQPLIAAKASLPNNFTLLLIIFTFLSAFKSILDLLVRALERFKLQAIVRIIEIFFLSVAFFSAVLFFKKIDYQIYLGVLLVSMTVVILSYFNKLKTYFKGFSVSVLKSLLSEGKFFMVGSILSTVFISSDRLLIAKYVDVANLGIYSAYYAASLGLVYTLSLILTNVLFPAAAKISDKSFTKKIDQLFVKIFFPVMVMISLSILLFIVLVGKAFPLRFDYVFLFAFIATLNFFQIVYNNIIIDASRKRYVQYFYITNVINLLTVAYYFILLKYLSKSIDFVLIGFLINIIINLIVQRYFIKKMREEQFLSSQETAQFS
jgi:O-antigen/teichoic acid export membrane protein